MSKAVWLIFMGFVIAEASAAPPTDEVASPLFFFKDGKVGFNFFGFHGAAGLNSLDHGGGLHAEVGTPFGQKAAAGFAGALGGDGALGGQLYAGATAGGNIKAAAGLGGTVRAGEHPEATGGLYSAAAAGPAKYGVSLAGGANEKGTVSISEKVVGDNVVVKVPDEDKTTAEPVVAGKIATDPIAIGKIVTPSTAKKILHVRGHPVRFDKFFVADAAAVAPPQHSPSVRQVKYTTNEATPADGGGFLAKFFAVSPVAAHRTDDPVQQRQSSFFDDIFNIPISTLGAVSKFLSTNIGPKVATNVRVEKTATTY